MCNDNILINTDFTNPVNQRGQTEYTGYGYTIDMWQSEGPTVKIEDGCIAISGEGCVVQKTELYLIKSLLGKTVTLSIMTDDYMLHTVTLDMPTTIGANTFVSPSIYFEGVTACIALVWDQQSYQTCRFTLGPDATIRLKKIKLEVGTVSTLKNELVKHDFELWKCQRYAVNIIDHNDNYPIIALAQAATATEAYATITLPNKMRIKPSVVFDKLQLCGMSGEFYDIKDMYTSVLSGNILRIDMPSSGLEPGKIYRIEGISNTAKLFLSAEL